MRKVRNHKITDLIILIGLLCAIIGYIISESGLIASGYGLAYISLIVRYLYYYEES